MSLSRQIAGHAARTSFTSRSVLMTKSPLSRLYSIDAKLASTTPLSQPTETSAKTSEPRSQEQPKKKTQGELDKELELKMSGIAGDGGEAGVELEDGQPVAMKRSVRNNMFRYI
ncbi:hypothetical protein P154DRAFT_304643 [Amniculicola lignicola CBS 123094]|uniref:Uncharacterized protein n=1 Tax=Amniculicola lignicola CBS 123094 TaxID=1392246 RepID=A0A6A5W691_9PLEO|nr:hypothetical protein P154DRAFT_304643 [Amniculicola lignicola CBS 123094]